MKKLRNKKEKRQKMHKADRMGYYFVLACMFGVLSFNVLTCQAAGTMAPAEYYEFYCDCMEIEENFIDLAEGALDCLSDEDEKRLVEQATGKKIK